MPWSGQASYLIGLNHRHNIIEETKIATTKNVHPRRPERLDAGVQQHPHRSISMAPSHVSAKIKEEVWQLLYGHDGKGVPKLHVSDRVRISKFKRLLEKGYSANWGEEIFTIHEVPPSDPPCTD